MNRRLWATLAVVALIGITGCLGGGPSEEDLGENATYDWETNANVSINVTDDRYQAVYNVTNQTRMDVYREDALGSREPLEIRAIQFRYTNGTVVNASAFNVSSNNERTRLGLPAERGQLAFTVQQDNKEVLVQTFRKGSYNVTLPEGTGVGIPLLARVSPGGFNETTVDGRTRLQWNDVQSDTLVVQYYLDRDLLIFGGLFAIGLTAAIGGSLYYYRQIRTLRRKREDVDADVDIDIEDDDSGPPPGMG
ncbi:hypothetical protein GJ629_02575 [Halapricum sp. CBA1109]|jgi:hypothetical protein|uniref:DUF5803 family protein n=1 Tax=Halapricum sp. CBA1109 TaxID=2668068 RepID=UPI0012FAABD0|nr:DUF5803 family protein [Halapricum sp. CBA1109]MUV88916.1 hypothetical protein [Halapricum sp. CBA1109]